MARNLTGKALLRASFNLFRQDPQMIWLPVIAAVTSFAAFAVVASPIFLTLGIGRVAGVLATVAGGIAATSASLVFQVAVVFAATDRIEGRTPTVRGSLSKAWTRRSAILKWAALSAIVGTAVSAYERRFGAIGFVLRLTSAVAWSVATFLVLPVLAFEDLGPIAAVRRSSAILRAQFGTVARSGLRFGALFIAWTLAALAVFGFGIALAAGTPVVGIPVAAIGLLCIFGVGMFGSVASLYLRTVLYRFATGLPVPNLGVDLPAAFAR